MTADVYRFNVGDFECFAISDGTFTYEPPLIAPPANCLFAKPAIQHHYSLSVGTGVLITSVTGGGPADNAGLRAGDIITKMDDEDISTTDDLISVIENRQIGDQVEIVFYRGSSQEVANATLEASLS